jgi:hypothetical protein
MGENPDSRHKLGVSYRLYEGLADSDDAFPPDPADSDVLDLSDSEIQTKPALGNFELAFRREVAQLIYRALTRASGQARELVLAEAQRRGLTVEQLLAAYLTRVLMDKVDREYL